MIKRWTVFLSALLIGLPLWTAGQSLADTTLAAQSQQKTKKQAPPKQSGNRKNSEAGRARTSKGKPAVEGAKTDANGKSDRPTEAVTKPKKPKVLTEWEPEFVQAERARCQALLTNIQAITLPEKSFRKGKCGAAAPVRLVAVGQSPQVVLSPPAIMTCRLANALHEWASGDLQKIAKKHLGDQIIQIEVMSDYSCRNTYGRKVGKLSEHALANAIDIRGFVTANGKVVRLLKSWGPTARDIAQEKARITAAQQAKREAEQKAEAEAAIEEQEKENQSADVGRKNAKTLVVKSTKNLLKVGDKLATAAKAALRSGGAPAPELVPLKKRVTDKGWFLRAAHKSACKIFGTTLGPEANEAHRNHFHLDMRPRKRSNYCE